MNGSVSATLLFVFAAGAPAQAPGDHFPLGGRLRFHAGRVAGPGSVLAAAAGAGLGQWRNEPPEWGQGGAGYGRRFGYLVAANGVKQAISFGAGALLKEDLRYSPSGKADFWPRTWNAVAGALIVPREGGGRTVAYSRLMGAYGAAFIANAWYPERRSNAGEAMLRGTIVLGGDVGGNVFREFWPDIKKKIFRKP
jgi:hypothetical protein